MLERSEARDASWDGRFVVGVVSTGIYCLPSCPARRPKPENVRFFPTVAAARAAGLRPCRRCRPDELRPGDDPGRRLAAELVARLRRDPAAFPDAAALRRAAGVGATRLAALCREHYHATPRQLLEGARVEAAQRRLLAGDGRVLDVALAVGFESLSSFHAAFRRRARMTPGDYRALRDGGPFTLALPRDFRPDLTLAFLGRAADSPTERVAGRDVVRALRLPEGSGRLHLELAGTAVRCRWAGPGRPGADSAAALHATALRLLGLHADPGPFERRLAADPARRRLLEGRRGLRIPQSASPFEGLTWAIVGQQVNLAFAYTLRRRLIARAGRSAGEGLTAHPGPEDVARLEVADLTGMQFSRRKAEYLIDAARAIAGGDLPLDELAAGPAGALEARLLAQRGVGPWTARYVMLRACGLADCVPVGDSGLTTALARFHGLDHRPGPDETEELMLPFAPYRSFATNHLWTSLGGPA